MPETHKPQRDEDLFKVYRKILSETKHPILLSDILCRTVNHTAQRFYVSFRFVYDCIKQLKQGETPCIPCNERKRLIQVVWERVRIEEQRYPMKRLKHIVEEILDSPAPEFYLKPSSAKIIIHYIKKKERFIQQQKAQDKYERLQKRKHNRW